MCTGCCLLLGLVGTAPTTLKLEALELACFVLSHAMLPALCLCLIVSAVLLRPACLAKHTWGTPPQA
jgi:hypothetical protein